MERDDAKKTPRIRYLSRREMLGLMGSTAAAITLAGCGGSERSGQPGAGETTDASTAAETASTTCVVRPEQTEGPYYVDTGLDRSDIREEREGVPLEQLIATRGELLPLILRCSGRLALRRGG